MRIKTIIWSAAFILLVSQIPINAQNMGHHNGEWGADPDSLVTTTFSGIVTIDSSQMMPLYFLDTNHDGNPDYFLIFGPLWYQPANSAATRPADGDSITITGGEHESMTGQWPVVIVYSIDGQFWREPYEPTWNHMQGENDHEMGGEGMCGNHIFGMDHDSLQTVSLNGTALIDSTFMHEQVYLDTNGDGTPDYFLNFGPPWYTPSSGATRPASGDSLSIVGGLLSDSTMSILVVYEINGLAWRDSSQAMSHFGGRWISRTMNHSQRVYAPFDTASWMQINPGWGGSGQWHHGGMMMPDSMYAQMMEVYPQNIPNTDGQNAFAAYEIAFRTSGGSGNMWQGNGCGGHMTFASNFQMQLHYTDQQLQNNHLSETNIQARYWDDDQNHWVTLHSAVVDSQTNTVSIAGQEIGGFVILTAESVPTGVSENDPAIAAEFALQQNYPNPFNPETTIEFSTPKRADVKLTIYNMLGKVVATPFNRVTDAGVHRVQFQAASLPSGIYFYEIRINNRIVGIRKMTLAK
ncbi:MAG: T9SS type A sorting domain-containing protein [Calditrichaeota bacterium]|nr:T9SS type A sorting domain-containing protein [Calditrichota bacterium]